MERLTVPNSVYPISEKVFRRIFLKPDQNVEFIETLVKRYGGKGAGQLVKSTDRKPISKCQIVGIHGTLFFRLSRKIPFYPNRRESDLEDTQISSAAARKLFKPKGKR